MVDTITTTPSTQTAQLTAWETVQRARHLSRPHTRNYVAALCSDFVELRGDRCWSDDRAILGGIGRTAAGSVVVLGHQRGRNTDENIEYSFGMPFPEGYRKALRLMRHAQKFGLPLICLLDTPGAQPVQEAEQRGQAQAIADNLQSMAELAVPIVVVIIGEGGSGGALGLGIGDRVLMLEHAIYGVATPEAAAAILWSDVALAPIAAHAMRMTAPELLGLGVINEIVNEPPGGAHCDPHAAIAATCSAILRHLGELRRLPISELLEQRYAKYRSIGA